MPTLSIIRPLPKKVFFWNDYETVESPFQAIIEEAKRLSAEAEVTAKKGKEN